MAQESKKLSIEQEKSEIIKIIQAIFIALDYVVEPEYKQEVVGDDTENMFAIGVKENAEHVIGHHGVNLRSLEHLAHIAARQKNIQMRFKIDINAYREEKKHTLESMAREAVECVKKSNKPFVLQPMSPYERRIIHSFVAALDHVTTDSIGLGQERKVIIKEIDNALE